MDSLCETIEEADSKLPENDLVAERQWTLETTNVASSAGGGLMDKLTRIHESIKNYLCLEGKCLDKVSEADEKIKMKDMKDFNLKKKAKAIKSEIDKLFKLIEEKLERENSFTHGLQIIYEEVPSNINILSSLVPSKSVWVSYFFLHIESKYMGIVVLYYLRSNGIVEKFESSSWRDSTSFMSSLFSSVYGSVETERMKTLRGYVSSTGTSIFDKLRYFIPRNNLDAESRESVDKILRKGEVVSSSRFLMAEKIAKMTKCTFLKEFDFLKLKTIRKKAEKHKCLWLLRQVYEDPTLPSYEISLAIDGGGSKGVIASKILRCLNEKVNLELTKGNLEGKVNSLITNYVHGSTGLTGDEKKRVKKVLKEYLAKIKTDWNGISMMDCITMFYGTSAGSVISSALFTGVEEIKGIDGRFKSLCSNFFKPSKYLPSVPSWLVSLFPLQWNSMYSCDDLDKQLIHDFSFLLPTYSDKSNEVNFMNHLFGRNGIHATDASIFPYKPSKYTSTCKDVEISLPSCVRASIAAPVYFPALFVFGRNKENGEEPRYRWKRLIDGGIFNNNPALSALCDNYHKIIVKGEGESPTPKKIQVTNLLLLSIGNGYQENIQHYPPGSVVQLINMVADTSNANFLIEKACESISGDNLVFRRLDPKFEQHELVMNEGNDEKLGEWIDHVQGLVENGSFSLDNTVSEIKKFVERGEDYLVARQFASLCLKRYFVEEINRNIAKESPSN